MLDFVKLIDEEISDFDKSTFDVKDHLAPEVWESEDNLHAGLRNTLIKIARDFFDDLELDGVEFMCKTKASPTRLLESFLLCKIRGWSGHPSRRQN